MKKKTLTVTALSLMLLAATLVALWPSSPPRPPDDAARQWPAATEKTYRLTLRGHTALPPLGDGRSGESDVLTTGLLRVRSFAGDDGAPRLSLHLTRLDEAAMTLFGEPAMGDRDGLTKALTSGEAVLTLRPEGDVLGIAFTPGSHNLFKSLAQTLAGELQLPVRGGDEWTVLDTTLRGTAVARYVRTPDGFERTRTAYPKLTAFGRDVTDVTVASQTRFVTGAGGLESLQSWESLTGTQRGARIESRLELSLTPVESAPLAAATLPGALEPSTVGEAPVPADWREQMLTQRAAGLTPREMADGLTMYGDGASPKTMVDFLRKASGLLLLEPELCASVAERASQPETPVRERVYSLEVLAAAGSPEAQAAMRDILSSPAVRDDAHRAARFQRLSLLQQPTVETVAFVGQAWREGTPKERLTLAVTLGATAGMSARAGHEAEALPWVAELQQAMRAGGDVDTRRSLVDALGNAGLEVALPDVLAATASPEAQVRASAVLALRKTPTPAAREAAVHALGDASVAVKSEAVNVLSRWRLGASERSALINGLRTGQLPLSLAHPTVSALESHAAEAEVKDFFVWLSTLSEADPSLQRRARVLSGGAL